jgi:hypothetical protein
MKTFSLWMAFTISIAVIPVSFSVGQGVSSNTPDATALADHGDQGLDAGCVGFGGLLGLLRLFPKRDHLNRK